MKIIAFAASSSTQSINKKLVQYATSLLENADVEILDLNDYPLPLFSVDVEKELGQPQNAQLFFEKIGACDALVISFAEHNGAYTAAFKNIYDWCSRINAKVYQDKPAVFLSTSPGKRGGATVMETALKSAERFGANVVASFSLPSFNDNFDSDAGEISDVELRESLQKAMASLSH